MKILILGANGQVGHELTQCCIDSEDCVSLDRKQVDFSVPGSITAAVKQYRPEIVINAVAYTSVDKAESEPSMAMLINGVAVKELARACKKQNAWCVHYSTDYVFDGLANQPYKETDRVNPAGIYGKTKLAGEEFLRQETDKYIILRTSWVYSWRGSNFVKTMLRLADDKDELNVVSDQQGCPSYAPDIAAATMSLLPGLYDENASGIYHLTGSQSTTWDEFARTIFKHFGKSVKVNSIPGSQYPTLAQRPIYSILDNDKLKQKFGIYLPGYGQSIDDCLRRISIAR